MDQLPSEQVIAEVKRHLQANPKTVTIGGAKGCRTMKIIKALNLLHSAGVKSVATNDATNLKSASRWRKTASNRPEQFWEPRVSKATEQNDKLKRAMSISAVLHIMLICGADHGVRLMSI